MTETDKKRSVSTIARAGLIAKGVVYLLLGFIAFFAAFGRGGNSGKAVSSSSAFSFIENLPAGNVLLWVLAAGLFCYSIWRLIQAFSNNDREKTKAAKRIRYFFSAVAYMALTYSLIRFISDQRSSGGNQNQQLAGQLMDKPYGPTMVVIAGLVLAAVGIYQIWYGLSEKYKKHVQSFAGESASILVRSGKIGYVARGIVWLLISYMLIRAGIDHKSSEAGNTGEAFQLLESSLGAPIAGAVGLGLVAYGIFCFVRAKHDRF